LLGFYIYCIQASTYLALVSLSLLLSGCAILPRQGPSSLDIALTETRSETKTDDYIVVDLDTKTIQVVRSYVPRLFLNQFGESLSCDYGLTLGIDDQLTVNIWEASPDGLFSTFERKQVQIRTEVDENGNIFIPYVGRVKAVGKTVEDVRQTIEQGLLGKAVEPQVQVILSANKSNKVVMVGDIAKPGHYPLPTRGMRLMEAVAQSGGTKKPTFETEATIIRDARNGTIRLDEVLKDPRNNIWLTSRDTVQILHRPRSFTAFGAVQSKNLVPFKTETVTLAEALAQAGGLNDNLADAGGVFLFRFESIDLVKNLNSEHKMNTQKFQQYIS